MRDRQLVALRVPSWWEVMANNFVEIEDPADLTPAERLVYLSEDVLTMRSRNHQVEVGWGPDGDPAGGYRLLVVMNDSDDIVLRFATRDQPVMRDAIELIIQGLSNGRGPEWILAQLADAMVDE